MVESSRCTAICFPTRFLTRIRTQCNHLILNRRYQALLRFRALSGAVDISIHALNQLLDRLHCVMVHSLVLSMA